MEEKSQEAKETYRSIVKRASFIAYTGIMSVIGGATIGIWIKERYIDEPTRHEQIAALDSSYANPDNLEIKLQDLIGSSKYQTTVSYQGKNYLMQLDSNRLVLREYEVKTTPAVTETKTLQIK